MTSTTTMSSAQFWGNLWGALPRDWALVEDAQMPTYAAAIEKLGIGEGQRVLDLGCGTGVFLRAAADRGAKVVGLDAAEGLLAIARERVPEADLHAGDMQDLPFGDDGFDVVTGFSSFFFADDMTRALSEACRVTKPGGTVLAQVFGRPEHCSLERHEARDRPAAGPRRRRAAVLALRHARAGGARRGADADRDLLHVVGVRVRRRLRAAARDALGRQRRRRRRARRPRARRRGDPQGARPVPRARRQLPAPERVALPRCARCDRR